MAAEHARASLLLRLAEPGSGRISCGGTDLSGSRPAELAAADRLGAPEADRFADTLAANLRLFNLQATDAQLAEAIGVAVLGEVVRGCPTAWKPWSAKEAGGCRLVKPRESPSPGPFERGPSADPR